MFAASGLCQEGVILDRIESAVVEEAYVSCLPRNHLAQKYWPGLWGVLQFGCYKEDGLTWVGKGRQGEQGPEASPPDDGSPASPGPCRPAVLRPWVVLCRCFPHLHAHLTVTLFFGWRSTDRSTSWAAER